MPIAVEYGPIAGALQLAAQAGQGQGYQIQSQRDMQALQLQQQMQDELDRQNAQQVQTGLAYNQLAAQQQQQQAQMAQQAAMANATHQLAAQQQQYNQQNQQAMMGYRTDQLNQRGDQFDQAQATREQLAQTLAALRAAQADKIRTGPDQSGQYIQANDAALRSMDQQALAYQQQLTKLEADLTKAKDPYTGNPEQAAVINQKIGGIQSTLDGIDAATGKKVGPGLNDKREALRSALQNFGQNLKPGARLAPNQMGGFDLENDQDNTGQQNMPGTMYPAGQPGQSGFQPVSQQPGVSPINNSLSTAAVDPKVKQAMLQILQIQ